MTRYLDLEVIVTQLTAEGLIVKDLGLLSSALARPQASAFGADAYPTFELKAAALVHSIVKNHPMMDGNKRSYWFVLMSFCLLNDSMVVATADEAFDFILGVATDKLDLEAMAAWVSQHLVKVGLNGD